MKIEKKFNSANENTMYQSFQDAAKAEVKWKFMALKI